MAPAAVPEAAARAAIRCPAAFRCRAEAQAAAAACRAAEVPAVHRVPRPGRFLRAEPEAVLARMGAPAYRPLPAPQVLAAASFPARSLGCQAAAPLARTGPTCPAATNQVELAARAGPTCPAAIKAGTPKPVPEACPAPAATSLVELTPVADLAVAPAARLGKAAHPAAAQAAGKPATNCPGHPAFPQVRRRGPKPKRVPAKAKMLWTKR